MKIKTVNKEQNYTSTQISCFCNSIFCFNNKQTTPIQKRGDSARKKEETCYCTLLYAACESINRTIHTFAYEESIIKFDGHLLSNL